MKVFVVERLRTTANVRGVFVAARSSLNRAKRTALGKNLQYTIEWRFEKRSTRWLGISSRGIYSISLHKVE